MKTVAVYAGPSLGGKKEWFETKDILNIKAPAKAGDILNLIINETNIKTIILADGLFYEKYAPMHREIMLAIDSGIEVIGCSSMGAIRAVELNSYGMIGSGKVFEYYKNNPETADDEVGLIHHLSSEYKPLTIPLVNLRILLSSINDTENVHILTKAIEYLSKLSFDKRYFNIENHTENNIGIEEERCLRKGLEMYIDFKSRDLKELVQKIMDKIYDEKKDQKTISQEKALHNAIESGKYQIQQYILAPHRKMGGTKKGEVSELDFRDLVAIGHQDYNKLLELTTIRSALCQKGLNNHIEASIEEVEKFKQELLGLYQLDSLEKLASRLNICEHELNIFAYKEIVIRKTMEDEFNAQKSVLCVGNLMDTMRAAGAYPANNDENTMLFSGAIDFLQKIKESFDTITIAKLIRNRIFQKNFPMNNIQLPQISNIGVERTHQQVRRDEIFESISRLLNAIK